MVVSNMKQVSSGSSKFLTVMVNCLDSPWLTYHTDIIAFLNCVSSFRQKPESSMISIVMQGLDAGSSPARREKFDCPVRNRMISKQYYYHKLKMRKHTGESRIGVRDWRRHPVNSKTFGPRFSPGRRTRTLLQEALRYYFNLCLSGMEEMVPSQVSTLHTA
jgi:hypothetical protein